jgi:Zn-dependent protease
MGGFDFADFISKFLIYFVVWIFAVSAHEAGHAWTSLKFGDDTAQRLGRVTLNPLPHIDVIGTLILPTLAFILSYSPAMGAVPLIMWGKPTPVNPLKWRNKDLANVSVSLAGIVVNLSIALVVSILIKVLIYYNYFTQENIQIGITAPIWSLLMGTVFLNVGLAVFNILPIPPLDGSKVLQTFLPESMEPVFEFLERFGFIILLLLLQAGVIGWVVGPLNRLILGILF